MAVEMQQKHKSIIFSSMQLQFVEAADKNSAISEAKLKEIAKIRSELNEALENEQENTPPIKVSRENSALDFVYIII